MPIVLPATSTPRNVLRSQVPALSAACACGMFRACARRSAIVCSAADTMFDCGALTTITPRRPAAATSPLSSPTPPRATTLRLRPPPRASAPTGLPAHASDELVSVAPPRSAYRGDGPCALGIRSEQVEPERADPVLDRFGEHRVPLQRGLGPVLEVQLEGRLQPLHQRDRRRERV